MDVIGNYISPRAAVISRGEYDGGCIRCRIINMQPCASARRHRRRRVCRTCRGQGTGGRPLGVTVIDRHNYHLFQPLLYQVATAALSPADIAAPIRSCCAGRIAPCMLAALQGSDSTQRRDRDYRPRRVSLRSPDPRNRRTPCLFRA